MLRPLFSLTASRHFVARRVSRVTLLVVAGSEEGARSMRSRDCAGMRMRLPLHTSKNAQLFRRRVYANFAHSLLDPEFHIHYHLFGSEFRNFV